MEWKNKYPRLTAPTELEIAEHINNPLWNELREHIESRYNVLPKVEHSMCSCSPGWNMKYRKKGKSICTLYPHEGFFTCLISIGAKEAQMAELVLSDCTEYTKNIYYAVSPFNGARWLMLDVNSKEILEDLKLLMEVRVNCKV